MCWLLQGSFDCFCCPHTSVHRPSIACLAVFLCGPGALFLPLPLEGLAPRAQCVYRWCPCGGRVEVGDGPKEHSQRSALSAPRPCRSSRSKAHMRARAGPSGPSPPPLLPRCNTYPWKEKHDRTPPETSIAVRWYSGSKWSPKGHLRRTKRRWRWDEDDLMRGKTNSPCCVLCNVLAVKVCENLPVAFQNQQNCRTFSPSLLLQNPHTSHFSVHSA